MTKLQELIRKIEMQLKTLDKDIGKLDKLVIGDIIKLQKEINKLVEKKGNREKINKLKAMKEHKEQQLANAQGYLANKLCDLTDKILGK